MPVPSVYKQWKRKRLLKHTAPGPLHDFYETSFADASLPITEVDIVSLDFETTGLDVDADHVLSLGLVEIRNLCIELDSAWHEIVYTRQDIPERTAVIHQITDDVVGEGVKIAQVLPNLLERLKGKVLLVHHAGIELGFLNQVCASLYQAPFMIPTIDTEVLAARQLKRQQIVIKSGQLRLYNLRRHYGLPPYRAHNALSDALATAELFLALANQACPKLDCKLAELLC